MNYLPILFHVDKVGILFALTVTIVWIAAGIFSIEYMKKQEHKTRYYVCYFLAYGILIAMDFAGNLITFYLCYELMTLLTVPLVFHTQTKEARMAGLKYLFYSLAGAYMALFGIFVLSRYTTGLTFVAGGTLDMAKVAGNEGLLLVSACLMLVGFGVKAGMFPLHAWLPTAHPVAPAPASAVLSGVIVKAGVLAMIRIVFYIFGADFLRGTWVQYTWMILALITIFMGSMLAYREPVLKKRLAYSTVSQVSYIVFGLALLDSVGFAGALMHTVFHAFIKCGLFLCAGAIIHETGKERVSELTGLGRKMPVLLSGYTVFALALIGIPPLSGFVSKWYLATGSLQSGIRVFDWLGPVILLVSALLTAGYLLPITIKGFFPGAEYPVEKKKDEPAKVMLAAVWILAILTVVLGLFPNPLASYISDIASQIM